MTRPPSVSLPRLFFRAAVAGFAGALIGAISLLAGFTRDTAVRIEPGQSLEDVSSGFFTAEQNDQSPFAWTMGKASVTLAGLDRRSAWRCVVRVRGARPEPLPQPSVALVVDGVTRATYTASNDYQDMEVVAPALSSRVGLTLDLVSSPTYIPGPSDRRELGVQLTRFECTPDTGRVLPPVQGLRAASLGCAALAAAFVLAGLSPMLALAAAALVGLAQASALTVGPTVYGGYPARLASLAIWIAVVTTVGVRAFESLTRRRIHPVSRIVVAVTASALFLQLLALLHPAKGLVDAVFHAHRLEWVLSGRFYFTQPLPDGVRFPYAIGLYVFAAPWSLLTRDYVMLLRVVVCAAHAAAGALLYWTVVRSWNDRLAGAAAAVLFQFAPLPFLVIGNANLTYAFGQSVAFVTLAAASAWPLATIVQVMGLTLLTSLTLLSHVGLVPLVGATLLFMVGLYAWRGAPALRVPARSVAIAGALAAVFSVAVYYGHFGESYRSMARVRMQGGSTQPSDATVKQAADPASPSLPARAARAASLAVRALGWPILILAAVGLWRLRGLTSPDRLTLALAALGAMYLLFVGVRVLGPIDVRFQRYADEFIDRVNYAALFGVAILAGAGFATAYRAGLAGRVAAIALGLAAFAGAVVQWSLWMRP
jgi:hypothetical protein